MRNTLVSSIYFTGKIMNNKIKKKVIEIMKREGLDTNNKALVLEMIKLYKIQAQMIKRAIYGN